MEIQRNLKPSKNLTEIVSMEEQPRQEKKTEKLKNQTEKNSHNRRNKKQAVYGLGENIYNLYI